MFSAGEVFKAIADNDLNYLARLIKEGHPINFRDVHMMTPLHRACSRYTVLTGLSVSVLPEV